MMRRARPWIGAGLLAATLAVAAAALPVTTAAAGQVELATTPRISVDELKKLVATGKVIVLDVRGPESYAAGHIPGAILVPLDTVASRAGEWRDAALPVVTYCSWPAEQTSARAALTLMKAGAKNVRALTAGFSGWVAGNNPVVRGTQPK